MPVKAKTVVELAESQCADVTKLRGSRAVGGERLKGVHHAALIRESCARRVQVPPRILFALNADSGYFDH